VNRGILKKRRQSKTMEYALEGLSDIEESITDKGEKQSMAE